MSLVTADVPSRVHEMSADEARKELKDFGSKIPMVIPEFADAKGEWLSSVDIAASVWGR